MFGEAFFHLRAGFGERGFVGHVFRRWQGTRSPLRLDTGVRHVGNGRGCYKGRNRGPFFGRNGSFAWNRGVHEDWYKGCK